MAFHIVRRDATYYWRRRVPRPLAKVLRRLHVFLSLRTTSLPVARRLAHKLDAIFEDAVMLAEDANLQISPAQLDGMLRAVVTTHLGKLERVAAAAKTFEGFDASQARADDKSALWAYRLLDAQGYSAVVGPEDRAEMAADGMSEGQIEAVVDHLAMLRTNELVPTKPHILRRLLDEVHAQPSALNMALTQSIYFRGMKLALAAVERRYGGLRPEDQDFVDRLLQSDVARIQQAPAIRNEAKPAEAPSSPIHVGELLQFAERIIAAKTKDDLWDEKTQRQVRSITGLLVKFLLQDQRVEDLNRVRQENLAGFVDFLRHDIYTHYGRSSRDKRRTIAELREVAAQKGQNKRGIERDTLNRHLGFLSQIFSHAAVRGAAALDEIDLSKLRVRGNSKRARDARPKLPLDRLKAVFATPPFNSCAGWNRMTEAGSGDVPLVFHCALYFVPTLIYYTGCRREELCGLMVDDVIVDNGDIPYLHIAKNARRRIKNAQSQRNIPLHPELLRLNLLSYVKAIKALGYDLLFPDLFSPSSRSPLGDRFYKELKPILQAADVTEKGLGAHAVRHLFGAQLKKKLVTEEERADLLGHGGDSETSERYCEPHEIATLMQFVLKLPVITDDLKPQEIHLIPWVAEKQIAPFSQPSRSKKAGAATSSRSETF
jgi:integrase